MAAQSTYTYKARDADGTVVTGSLVADSPEEVGARLRSNGKFVLSVSQNAMRSPTVSLDADQIQRNEAAKRVRREDVIAFCQQLAVMLETGVPLSEAIDVICGQNPSRDFRKVLEALREDLYAGEPFSSAMAKWPKIFPTMMLSLMKAAEASGTMALMLGRVGDYLARERRTAKQIKGALAYPTFMLFCGLAVTVFLTAFVLPRFAQIYASRSASLPVPTRVLIVVSDFLNTQYIYYGPVLVVGLVVGVLWLRSAAGRRAKDWLRLNVPAVRTMYGQLYISRTARTMSTLLSAGVNLLDIIDICRGVTNNHYYDEMWDAMAAGVHEGGQLSEAMFNVSFIPPSVASMIGAGERSGRLSEVMVRIAEFSEEELDRAVSQVTTFIEPVMIVIMGVVIGGMAVALLLPIFGMSQVMAGG